MTEVRIGDSRASAVIWRWREPESKSEPTMGRVRLQGSLQALVGALVGLTIFRFWSRGVGVVACVLAGIVLVTALASPTGLYAALRRLFDATGRVVGRVVTWIVMIPIFYLFFLPFGKLLRRGRRDQLRRYFDVQAQTYWEPHMAIPTSSRERQY